MFGKICAGVVLGAALVVGAGCESSGDDMHAQLETQDKLKRDGEKMVADGAGQRARGLTLQEQGMKVQGVRDTALGEGKMREGQAMIDQAERRRQEILRQAQEPSAEPAPQAETAGHTEGPSEEEPPAQPQ